MLQYARCWLWSGILSILGQHIGFKSIHGIDNDENAIQNSLHNLSLNFHESTIKFEQKSIDSFENDSYDCIVANIQSDVLIKNAQRLVELLKNNGVLILSGILNYETEDVSKVYSKLFENKNMSYFRHEVFKGVVCYYFQYHPPLKERFLNFSLVNYEY